MNKPGKNKMPDAVIIRVGLVGAYIGLIIIGVKVFAVPETVTAHKFVVVDDWGDVAIELKSEPNGAGRIIVYSGGSLSPVRHACVEIGEGDWAGGKVLVLNDEGGLAAAMSVDKKSDGFVSTHRSDGEQQVVLHSSDRGAG